VSALILQEEVAADLMRINEATADEGLEEARDAHGVAVDVEHLANVEVHKHPLVVEHADSENSVVDVGEREHVPIRVLRDDIALDVAAVDGHALHLLDLLHQLQVVVVNVIDFVVLLAQNNCTILPIDYDDGDHHLNLGLHQQA
jgi:hypothetical protein